MTSSSIAPPPEGPGSVPELRTLPADFTYRDASGRNAEQDAAARRQRSS